MDIKVSSVVISRAGHDKGESFAVVRLEGAFAHIADGRSRTLENPKRKNLKHLAATAAVVSDEALVSNKSLRTELAEKIPSAVRPQP